MMKRHLFPIIFLVAGLLAGRVSAAPVVAGQKSDFQTKDCALIAGMRQKVELYRFWMNKEKECIHWNEKMTSGKICALPEVISSFFKKLLQDPRSFQLMQKDKTFAQEVEGLRADALSWTGVLYDKDIDGIDLSFHKIRSLEIPDFKKEYAKALWAEQKYLFESRSEDNARFCFGRCRVVIDFCHRFEELQKDQTKDFQGWACCFELLELLKKINLQQETLEHLCDLAKPLLEKYKQIRLERIVPEIVEVKDFEAAEKIVCLEAILGILQDAPQYQEQRKYSFLIDAMKREIPRTNGDFDASSKLQKKLLELAKKIREIVEIEI